jgi:hypothetical protein
MLERTKRPARGAFFILGQARRATLDDGIKFPQTDSNRYPPTILLQVAAGIAQKSNVVIFSTLELR